MDVSSPTRARPPLRSPLLPRLSHLLCACDLFCNSKVHHALRGKTAAGGAIFAAVVATTAVSIAWALRNSYFVVRTTQFSAHAAQHRLEALTLNLDVEFPSAPCHDLTLHLADGTGTQQVQARSALHKVRLDADGRPVDGAKHHVRLGETAAFSSADLYRWAEVLGRGVRSLRSALAAGDCARDWTAPCPLDWEAGPGGLCHAPVWYYGACPHRMSFERMGEPARREWSDACASEWRCRPGVDVAPEEGAAGNATGVALDAPRAAMSARVLQRVVKELHQTVQEAAAVLGQVGQGAAAGLGEELVRLAVDCEGAVAAANAADKSGSSRPGAPGHATEKLLARALDVIGRALQALPNEGCRIQGVLTAPFAPGRLSITPGYEPHRVARPRRRLFRPHAGRPAGTRGGRESEDDGRGRAIAHQGLWWNSSHMIHALSFGPTFKGQRSPLAGVAYSAAAAADVRYDAQIVLTEVQTGGGAGGAAVHQSYAASRHVRKLGHDVVTERMPGWHLLYGISPHQLHVEERWAMSAWQLAAFAVSAAGNLFVVGAILDKCVHRAMTAAELRAGRAMDPFRDPG